MTTVIESLSTVAITEGNKVSFDKANASRERFWDAVTNEHIGAANCPQMALFSFSALQQYLAEAKAEFERLGIPEKDRGIAVMPVMHNGEQRFNILFTPCVKDEQGKCHHQFNGSPDDGFPDLDWTLPGFDEGGLQP